MILEGKLPRRASGSWLVSARRTATSVPGGLSARVDRYYKRFSDLLVGRLETDAERLARLAGYDVPATLWSSVPSRAEITTSPLNAATGQAYGVTHPFDYDRRHALSVAANFRIGPRFDVSVTGRWATGLPRTPVRGVRLSLVPDGGDVDGDGNQDERVPQRDAQAQPLFRPDLGDVANINSARLPRFARLDARLNYRPRWSGERWAFYLDLLNVLNAKNVPRVDSALVFDPASDRPGIKELSPDRGIPFFPSFGIRFWF